MLYKVFPTSLKRPTLTWYKRLPPRSIDSFTALAQRFRAQYAIGHPHEVNFSSFEGEILALITFQLDIFNIFSSTSLEIYFTH